MAERQTPTGLPLTDVTDSTALRARPVAHRHHHTPGHGRRHLHYRHHHHHRCCDRQAGHVCNHHGDQDAEDQNDVGPAPRTATFGRHEQEDVNATDPVELYDAPRTAPLRLMRDVIDSSSRQAGLDGLQHPAPPQPIMPAQVRPAVSSRSLQRSSSRNLLTSEGRNTPAPSYRTEETPYTTASETDSSRTIGNGHLRQHTTSSTGVSDDAAIVYGTGHTVYMSPSAIATPGQRNLPHVHFQPSRTNTADTTTVQGDARGDRTRTTPRVSNSSSGEDTMVPIHAFGTYPRSSMRESMVSMNSTLHSRDKRFSAMVDDCLPQAAMLQQQDANALRRRAVPTASKRQSGLMDQVMGLDHITPGDLVYGEGAKIDGGFGFAIPTMARESTLLLDSRSAVPSQAHRISFTTSSTDEPAAHSTSHDSSQASSRFSSDSASIASRLSGLFSKRRASQAGRGGRTSGSSFASSQLSFNDRLRQPTSLSERVAMKDLRPSQLDLDRSGARGGTVHLPASRLRHSTTASSEQDSGPRTSGEDWEDVQLNTGRGKNERLARAVGARLSRPASNDSSGSELTVIEEEPQEKDIDDKGDYPQPRAAHVSTAYGSDAGVLNEKAPRFVSGVSDSDGYRATMNLPPGLSQADIVAICLVQGMVPPGLPPDDTLVTWSGPLSPTNPRNWSVFSKWYACILVSWSTFLANAATNMIAPALGLMSETYKELYVMAIRGCLIGSYIFAFTFAPLLFGPMSEIMGRKPVLIVGSTMFAVACLLSGFVTATWQLMILRFLSALGASAPMSIGGAVLTDIFAPDQRGRAMTLFALAPQLGPVLGPIMGGWVTQEAQKWRWIFFIAAICGFTAAVPMLFIHESYTPRILAQRARRMRRETGNNQLTTIFERRRESKRQIMMRGVVRPLVLFSCEPIVQLLTVYVSLIYGIIHLMVATFPAVFGTIYAEYPGWASMHFMTIGIGTITGGFVGGYLVERHYHNLSLRNGGVAKPEYKFYCMLYVVWIPPVGLLLYGLITYYGIHWIFADLGIVVFCFGISIAVVAIQSYIVDCYALLAGSALTATIVFRSIVGTGATIGSEDLLLHGGMLWSNVALAAACVLIGIPCAYAVYFGGAALRQRSRHATHKR